VIQTIIEQQARGRLFHCRRRPAQQYSDSSRRRCHGHGFCRDDHAPRGKPSL